MEKFDSTDKANWNLDNAQIIAAAYGYCLNENFLVALNYMISLAQSAKIVMHLGSVAQGTFTSWQPPLDKIHTAPTDPIITSVQKPSLPQTPSKGCIFSWFKRSNHR